MATEPTAKPDVDALPVAPTRNSPTTFRARMDAFLAAMVTFRTQIVALAAWIVSTAQEVYDNAVEAAASASAASDDADAAEASATNASNAQTAAEAAAAATIWVSGGTYVTGDLHWSPINGATYRAITDHSGETDDPSVDPVNWGPLLTLSSATDATFYGTTAFNGAFTEEVYPLTGLDLNPENGTIQYKVLAGNTTFTESLSTGQSILLRIENGEDYTVVFPVDKWVGGSPILSAEDVVVIWQEGTTRYGCLLGGAA